MRSGVLLALLTVCVAAPAGPVAAQGLSGLEEIVELGLDWLVRHQDTSGKWSSDGFGAS